MSQLRADFHRADLARVEARVLKTGAPIQHRYNRDKALGTHFSILLEMGYDSP